MSSVMKKKIAAGEMLIVVNPGGDNADAVEMLGRQGADIVFVDAEHTGIGLDAVGRSIRAARAAGLASIVRSWSHDPAIITQYFDRQAGGIVLPHCESAAQAKALVEVTRYACRDAAGDKILVVQIESKRGVEEVDEIAAVPGIDAVLLGPNDLTWDMTGGSDQSAAEVQRALDHVCARLRVAGKPFGMPVPLTEIARFRARGGSFCYHPLEYLLRSALAELKQRLQA